MTGRFKMEGGVTVHGIRRSLGENGKVNGRNNNLLLLVEIQYVPKLGAICDVAQSLPSNGLRKR